MKWLAKYVGLPAALVWGVTYLWNTHPEVFEASTSVVWAVDWVLSWVYEPAMEVLSATPLVWAAAPFAFPTIAGWSLGYKLADVIWVENKVLKHLTAITGAWLWFAASQSVLAPYLGMYWMYKAGKVILDKKLVPRLFKWTTNVVSDTVTTAVRSIVEPFVAWYDWLVKNQWAKPKIATSYDRV